LRGVFKQQKGSGKGYVLERNQGEAKSPGGKNQQRHRKCDTSREGPARGGGKGKWLFCGGTNRGSSERVFRRQRWALKQERTRKKKVSLAKVNDLGKYREIELRDRDEERHPGVVLGGNGG